MAKKKPKFPHMTLSSGRSVSQSTAQKILKRGGRISPSKRGKK